jgi:hypothetical protein
MVFALSVFFWIRAPRLAHDEALTFRVLRRWERQRTLTYRLIAVFLFVVAVGLMVSAAQ